MTLTAAGSDELQFLTGHERVSGAGMTQELIMAVLTPA
jgi:hypothetical protein